jgi:probable rRNA maturation factor
VSVEIADRQRRLRVDRTWMRNVVRSALGAAGIGGARIGVLVLDDDAIAVLHERWLGIPGPTDVLTFDLAGREEGLCGDIAVSAETARRAARELGWAPRHELAYYVIHGLLHLAGCDDRDPASRRRMRSLERKWMAAAGLPAPPRRRPRRTAP